jgi:hypothetical protein
MRPTLLTDRFDAALTFARERHGTQIRKGTEITYVAHLLAVAALVLEDGGDEDAAIAGLLHDVAEDAGGEAVLVEIEGRFGEEVRRIVAACSDTFEDPKPDWRIRKRRYLAHLRDADDAVLRVSLADKLHNARSIVSDVRVEGDALWSRFNTGRAADQLWYYRTLADIALERRPGVRTDDLDTAVCEMAIVATGAAPEGPLRIWVDDDLEDRAPTDGWLQVATAWEAIALLATGRVIELSLDHDLAGDAANGRGVDVVDWLAERASEGRPAWPHSITLHTANPYGRDDMARVIRRHAPVARESLSPGGKPVFEMSAPDNAQPPDCA